MASWYWNTAEDRVDASETLNELMGVPAAELIDSCAAFKSHVHPADVDAYRSTVENAVAQGVGWRAEFRIQRPDDDGVTWLEERAEAQIDRASGRVDYSGLVWDVTAQKLQEQAIQHASRRKDEFLATLAHELRNPLAPICNSLQLLRMANVEPETRRQVLDMLDRQATHMVRLVDELMEVSRITRGAITLRRELVDLAQVAATAVEAASPAIQAAAHRLTVSAPGEAAVVDGDPIRLAQVITNLLDNAAKYTEPGGSIELKIRREQRTAVIEVSDTGIGIAPDMLSRVFEVFARVDQEAAATQRGLGIGLALVKNIVELHGGHVAAHSRGRGTGTQFVVRLPLAAGAPVTAAPPPAIAAHEAPLAGWNVLAVDDNRDAADSLALLLETLGAAVRTAYSGPAALQAVAADPPAVVFLDLGMPGMDGYAVAEALRRDPRQRGLLIVALTGWGQEEDRRRTAAAGFDEHLVKPPSAAAILELLAKARMESAAR
jgi:signal transduction histidine kinase/ActR/RegA family two-component response regulator